MKLLLSLILVINLISNYSVFSYECNKNQTYGNLGDTCVKDGDCSFPEICFDSICSKIHMTGEVCKRKADCTLSYNWGDCVDGKCILVLGTGEKCKGPRLDGVSKCTSSSECSEDGICKLKQPCNNYNCPLNQYCDSKDKICKPNPAPNKCSNDNECPSTHICSKTSKCIAKYSSKIGQSCKDSPMLCNVYNGEICSSENNKCIKNDKYGKQCKDESTCGNGGLCICNDKDESVCVGPNGELSDPTCVELEQKLQKCIENSKCNSLTPFTCKPCFKLSECIQHQCNAVEKYYKYKSNYYKNLNCASLLL